MSSFKFGQIEIASKDFHKQKHVADILIIDVSKIVLFDSVMQLFAKKGGILLATK